MRLCRIADIPQPGMRIFSMGGREVLVVRSAGGSVAAIGAKCTHRGAPLAEGMLEGNTITCPWHGSQFEVPSGKLIRGPQIFGGKFLEKIQRNLPRYSLEVRGEELWMDFGT